MNVFAIYQHAHLLGKKMQLDYYISFFCPLVPFLHLIGQPDDNNKKLDPYIFVLWRPNLNCSRLRAWFTWLRFGFTSASESLSSLWGSALVKWMKLPGRAFGGLNLDPHGHCRKETWVLCSHELQFLGWLMVDARVYITPTDPDCTETGRNWNLW